MQLYNGDELATVKKRLQHRRYINNCVSVHSDRLFLVAYMLRVFRV
jgi:hypothetical protein